MITISSVSEHYDTNVQILLHPTCLPISYSIDGEVRTIARGKDGKYILAIKGCPFTIPFNRLENLLYSEFTCKWCE